MASDSPIPLNNAWLPLQGPFARWPRVSDAVLAMVVCLWSLFVTDGSDDLSTRSLYDLTITAFGLYAISSASLYWRRSYPAMVLGINLGVLIALTTSSLGNSLWSMPFALYALGRYVHSDRLSYVGLVVTIVLTACISLLDGDSLTNIGFGGLFVVLIWCAGRYLRVRGNYLRLLEERTAALERQQDMEAHRAVVEERTRIARELHDVVAHSVSLMTVQAGAAKTIAQNDPIAATQAMEAVEGTGRQALDELRHLLGVLRTESEASGLGPQPGISDLPRLVEELNEAGVEVSLTIDGVTDALPARVALSVYRIVQEALTNVLKHAGSNVKSEVKLSADSKEINIEITDNGCGTTTLPGSGNGIVGMRERAQLLGGRLQAGPKQPRGFRVAACLPVQGNTP